MGIYAAFILPRLTHWVCSQHEITGLRQLVVPQACGRIVEIGIGSGLNLPFYDPSTVEKIIGIDPAAPLVRIARQKARQLPFKVEFLERSCERMPLESRSVDTVLSTYTLCSIPDVASALKEAKRVLKPSGRLLFCDHGKSPEPRVNQWQARLNPPWKRLAGGCNLDRPIADIVTASGFEIISLEAAYMGPLKIVGFNYRGIAVPKS